MMPGMNAQQMKGIADSVDDKKVAHLEAMILSMTPQERSNPDLMNTSRKARIARGAGVDISEVNRLTKQHKEMQKQMKQFSGMMGNKNRNGLMGKFKKPF